MVAVEQGDSCQPFSPTSLPIPQPAETALPGKIRLFPVLGCMGQAKRGLCPRCLIVLSQGSSANKEKEGGFMSDRVAWHDQHVVTLW